MYEVARALTIYRLYSLFHLKVASTISKKGLFYVYMKTKNTSIQKMHNT